MIESLIRRARIVMLAIALAAPAEASPVIPVRRDVVISGATPAGIMAAVAAAQQGKSVIILEPGQFLGGMVTGGLGATDAGNRGAIGGLARDFYRRVLAHYVATDGAKSPQVQACSDGFLVEPHVADLVLRSLLDRAGIEVILGCPIQSVQVQGGRLRTVTVRPTELYQAEVFIDATYEGDLMALAGVPSVVGRESAATAGESLAGVQARSPAHQWPLPIAGRAAAGGLLPLIQAGPAGPPGGGDAKVQAYTYRLCMTDRPANRVPFPKPAGYDPARYELLARYLAARPDLKLGQLTNPVRLPNGKTDTNNNGPISTDHMGANWDYPTAAPEARRAIVADHLAYVQGFCYFLANDPRVPPALHAEMARWGLAQDEFTATDHWPHQLYVREARRMVGAYVMTQADVMADRAKPDAVGLGSYTADSHHVQRTLQPDGSVSNEGDFQVRVRPYAIPYRSLTPRRADLTNLLVPVCLAATHVAYGTIRMEPVYMILGEAAGTAAALAIEGKVAVQDVPVGLLQARLKGRGAILDPDQVPSPPGSPAALDPTRLDGVVVDDSQGTFEGDWHDSAALGPFVGLGYRHDGGTRDGRAQVRLTPDLPHGGRYEVRVFAPASSNRATNVPVLIRSADGDRATTLNQRRPDPGGRPGTSLGTFRFEAGRSAFVQLRNDGTDGHVVIDAVQFVPQP